MLQSLNIRLSSVRCKTYYLQLKLITLDKPELVNNLEWIATRLMREEASTYVVMSSVDQGCLLVHIVRLWFDDTKYRTRDLLHQSRTLCQWHIDATTFDIYWWIYWYFDLSEFTRTSVTWTPYDPSIKVPSLNQKQSSSLAFLLSLFLIEQTSVLAFRMLSLCS